MTETEKQIAEVEEARKHINEEADKALAYMEQNKHVVQNLKDAMNKAADAKIAGLKEQKDEDVYPEVKHYLSWLGGIK